jgi:hypothetical protein
MAIAIAIAIAKAKINTKILTKPRVSSSSKSTTLSDQPIGSITCRPILRHAFNFWYMVGLDLGAHWQHYASTCTLYPAPCSETKGVVRSLINQGQRITQRITVGSIKSSGRRGGPSGSGLCACFTDPRHTFRTTNTAKLRGGDLRQYIERRVEHDVATGMVTTYEHYRMPAIAQNKTKVWTNKRSTTIRKSADRTWALKAGSVGVDDELRLYLFGGLYVPGPPLSWIESR